MTGLVTMGILAGGAAAAGADPELVTPEELLSFGQVWQYGEPTGPALGGGADAPAPMGSVAESWLEGPSPFILRSVATEAAVEAERRRIRRLRRRRGRSVRSQPFHGTLVTYDSASYPVVDGAASDYEPGPNTLRFSTTFSVEDVDDIASLFLEVRFSGGFVARLNGREWVRHNVDPGGPADAPADIVWQPEWVAQTVGNVWQRAFLGLDPSLLVEGENHLEIEVRRRGNGGPMAGYLDAQVRAYREVGFIRTPYLQNVGPESMTVLWETSVPAIGYVEYGDGDWLEYVATAPRVASTEHEVVLTGLRPNTRYFYRVHSLPVSRRASSSALASDAPDALTSAIHWFRTAVPRGVPFNFIAYGDNRTNSSIHARLIERMMDDAERNEVGFVLNTGDLTTHGSWWDEWQDEFFVPALPLMATYPMYAVLGNHEGNHESFYEMLDLPDNEAWYTFSYGDADFFGINSSADFQPGSPQHTWLEQTLADSDAIWKIAFFHHPPFSCVPSRKPGNQYVVDYLVPLFEQYGVNLVLLGHDHLYGRSVEMGGVTYVITGGGGASTYPAEPDEINPVCVQEHHYCILRVSDRALELEAITIDGELLDQFALTR